MIEVARTPRPLLFSDAFDFLAVGGASLIVPLSLGLYVKLNATWNMTGPLATLLWLALILPHYTSSYQLLYWDRRGKIFREPSYFFAAVLVPVAAAGLLTAVYFNRPLLTMAGLLHMLFFLSGWHYAKQAYGATVALSAAKSRALSMAEKSAIRINLLALAVVSFVIPNTLGSFPYEGVYYHSLGFPSWFGTFCLCALAATMGGLALALRRRLREGPGIPWVAAAAFLSIYAWGFPLIFYPQIFHAFRDVPFVAALHSLQYLVFVMSLRLSRRPAVFSGALPGVSPLIGVALSLLAVVIFGDVLARLLPQWLDRALTYDRAALGAGFFVFAAAFFINIHHYFIDSVIWRGDNHEFRALITEKSLG